VFFISCDIQASSLQFSRVDADPADGVQSFVDVPSDDNDPYDPATANWRYANLHA